MNLRILFFATLRDSAGGKEQTFELPAGSTMKDLRDALAIQYPALAERLPTALAAVNKEYAFDADLLPDGAEVAFFPPVSGGEQKPDLPGYFAVSDEDIDLNDLLAQITLDATGAAAIFTGMVRGTTERDNPHQTVYLEYEAYRPMAEAKMRQVADEIRQRWPTVQGVAIVQRVGRLYPRTPTVLIACTAPHRDTGVFDAARYGIDRLKEIVPVWKKEVGPNGEEWVEGDYIPNPDDRG